MSDEDRDVDIESDDDDDTVAGSSLSQAEKRAHHNALERKRRDHIKESFHSLRDCVPALHGDKVGSPATLSDNQQMIKIKASRAQILKQATEYIQFMTKKNGTHQNDIEDLKRQNILLEQQVRALEKAKAAGTFAAAQTAILEGSATSKKNLSSESGSDTSDSDSEETPAKSRRKKMKT